MPTRWDPHQYLRYGDERGRPFAELVARIDHPRPGDIVDLGCGPGTTTAQLLDRWPDAHVLGIDNSPEMIEHAASLALADHLEFRVGDLREWAPDEPVDVVLSCATLQWIPGHVKLFERFVSWLTPGGAFAFQVPGNFNEPSHVLLRELASSERWNARVGHLGDRAPVHTPTEYLEALLPTGAHADVWETTYLHVLRGPDAVLEWVRGTALRPYLSALEGSPGDTDEFIMAYAAALRAAYPRDEEGRTVFPFRRIFAIATVPGPSGGVA